VAKEDAGAASGLVNATHQLGGSLGLAVLVVAFAAYHVGTPTIALASGVSAALSAASIMLVLALFVALALIVWQPRAIAIVQLGRVQ
jgi:hypothetical protein